MYIASEYTEDTVEKELLEYERAGIGHGPNAVLDAYTIRGAFIDFR